jgi:type II secretory pathway component PulJ
MDESSWIDAMVADARNGAKEPADLLDYDRFWAKRSYLKEKSLCATQPLPTQAWQTLFEQLAPIKTNVLLHRMGQKVGVWVARHKHLN